MEGSQLVQEGFSLMLFGMGFVFVFLSVLVIAMSAMSRLVMRFAPQAAPASRKSSTAVPAHEDGELVAVISAAIQRHRQRRDRH
ncbi:OadG family protein [Halomonas shantousis]